MGDLVQMKRRKTPADAFIRSRLAAYGMSARAAIREARQTFEYRCLRAAGGRDNAAAARAQFDEMASMIRWDYQQTRAAFEAVDVLPPAELARYLERFQGAAGKVAGGPVWVS